MGWLLQPGMVRVSAKANPNVERPSAPVVYWWATYYGEPSQAEPGDLMYVDPVVD